MESKLLYGLVCGCLTVAEKRRLDGFQARCLRQVLGIQPAFFSRVSNSTVRSRARQSSATALLEKQQLELLGRVLRAPVTTPLHTAALVPGTETPVTSFYIRRRGRPRKEWVPTAIQRAHQMNNTHHVGAGYPNPAPLHSAIMPFISFSCAFVFAFCFFFNAKLPAQSSDFRKQSWIFHGLPISLRMT